jgi:hypothetical protein
MELDGFRQYLEDQNLNKKTIENHIRNLDNYPKKVGESQRIIINQLNLNQTWARRLSRANTLSKYLQFKNLPNDEIVAYIKSANEAIQAESKIRQANMADDKTLPTVRELKNEMNSLYDKGDYRGYCILYLFITYQVRNMDLIAQVVKSKKETNETDNWFIVGRKQVTFIRNKYKTKEQYGTKTHIIKNEKFMTAIKTMDHLLKESDNIDRVVKKVTHEFGGINEGTIAKIMLKANNTMNGLRRISRNRGTDMTTLVENYNITKK